MRQILTAFIAVMCIANTGRAQDRQALFVPAVSGDADAQLSLALTYQTEPMNFAASRFWLEQAAAQDHAAALVALADLLHWKSRQPHDGWKAESLYQRAIDLGSLRALDRLGLFYMSGDSPRPDAALALFRDAIAQGYPPAGFSLVRLKYAYPGLAVPGDEAYGACLWAQEHADVRRTAPDRTIETDRFCDAFAHDLSGADVIEGRLIAQSLSQTVDLTQE